MPRTATRSFRWLLGLWLLIGRSAELAAQRPPTIAAAANLKCALTEVAKEFYIHLQSDASRAILRKHRFAVPE